MVFAIRGQDFVKGQFDDLVCLSGVSKYRVGVFVFCESFSECVTDLANQRWLLRACGFVLRNTRKNCVRIG